MDEEKSFKERELEEIKKLNKNKKIKEEDEDEENNDKDEDEGEVIVKEKTSKKKIIIILINIIFIIAIIVSGFFIIKWFNDNKKTEEILNQISESITINKEEDSINLDVDFENLKKINNDIVGYIRVKNTSIDYPVVKCGDNEYYLTHSLDNSINSAGWVFADYKNKFDTTDKNIVLYGHNRKDGTMFRTLRNTLEEEWYTNPDNQEVIFVTENEKNKYKVFSIYKIENEDYYITTEFSNSEYKKFLKTIKSRSIHDFGVELNEDDQILTLSTCDNNNKYRIALHAKKIVE